MKYNRKWVSMLDVVLSMAIMWILSLIYYWWLKAYYKNTTRAENAIYTNFALTECAEVVHSIRYWEWDKAWSIWWETFVHDYPTWLYQMEYNNVTYVWELKPIYNDVATETRFINFREMLATTWYITRTEWENFFVWPTNVQMRRYVFINNNIRNRAVVQCYAKFYDPHFRKQFADDENDFFNYEELKFIMTNYM